MDARTARFAQRVLAVMGLGAPLSGCSSAPTGGTRSDVVDLARPSSSSGVIALEPSATTTVTTRFALPPPDPGDPGVDPLPIVDPSVTSDPRPPSTRTIIGPFDAPVDYGTNAPTCVPSPQVTEQCPPRATLKNQRGQQAAPLVRVDGDKCCYGPAPPGFHWRGRALRGPAGVALAPAVARGGWAEAVPLELGALSESERLALADVWLRDAAFEHASVAAFARLSLDLLALGAPSDLVADAHRAAVDEVAHAETAYGVASQLLGRRVGPSPLASPPCPAPTLASLARECLRDGCYGESVAVMLAHAAADATSDPTLRRAYERIAEEEQRHAELAFRVVAWAVRADASAGAVVAEERAALASSLDPHADPFAVVEPRHEPLEPYGVLSEVTELEVRDRTVRAVVLPALDRLLAA